MDRASFASYTAARETLLRRFVNNGVSHSTAEDLAQETFLIWGRRREDGVAADNFMAYLQGIASNLLKKHWEQKAKQRARELPGPATWLEALPDLNPGANPLAQCSHNELAATLALALASLRSQRCRTVLRMRFWEGRSHREIAEHLCLSKPTVQQYEQRGLKAVRDFLETHTG